MAKISEVKNYMVLAEKGDVALSSENTLEVSTFYIGDYLFGIDILLVQEINPYTELTPVPHAPYHIRGVMNLRGQIVTVIDMREVFGMEKKELTMDHRNIIIESDGERVGLLVDTIADVIEVNPELIEPPPRLSSVECKFIKGVYKLDKKLLMLLDVEQVLNV